MPAPLATARSALRRDAAWAYDAAETSNRRRSRRVILQSEDAALPADRRRKVVSSTRDLQRNFEVAAWAIRLHLNFVASHSFEAHTGDAAFDKVLETFVWRWGLPGHFDASGRHSLRRAMRLAEARRVVDGDIVLQRLRSGLVAPIEGDRIRDPLGPNRGEYTHGVRTAKNGRHLGYAVHKRTAGNGFTFDREISAQHCEHFAYFDRFDQTRGISPLAAAINRLRDTYECFDYALAKAKITQLFGLALYRADDEAVGDVTTTDDATGAEDKSAATVDFGKGPFQLDLDQDDKAEFLESKQPAAEFQNYTGLMISVALKALDIPMIYFDESRTNFSGARGAVILYEMACRDKQADVRELLDRLTYWRLLIGVLNGEITLPRGWTLDDVLWEWIPNGMAWINPAQEVNADIEAINAGLNSPQRVCKKRQIDFDDILDELREARTKLNALPPIPANTPSKEPPHAEDD